MKFVPVPGTKVLFCIHETRVSDFTAFMKTSSYNYNRDGSDGPRDTGGGETARKESYWKEPGFLQTANHPVVFINSADAEAFCEWLTLSEGKKYRLPTDYEWSCAVGIGEYEDPRPCLFIAWRCIWSDGAAMKLHPAYESVVPKLARFVRATDT